MTSQNLGQRALTASVTTHHGVNLTGFHLKVHPIQDRLVLNRRMQIIDFEERLGVGTNHVRRKRREKRVFEVWRWS
jgi:hypothetical protein